jgi:hypothetical protein
MLQYLFLSILPLKHFYLFTVMHKFWVLILQLTRILVPEMIGRNNSAVFGFLVSKPNILQCLPDPVFLNVLGTQESIPRNRLRQPM